MGRPHRTQDLVTFLAAFSGPTPQSKPKGILVVCARTEARLTTIKDQNDADIVWRSDEDGKASTIALLKRMRRIAAFCTNSFKDGTNSFQAKQQFMRLYVGYVKGTAIPDVPEETATAVREPKAFTDDMF